MQKTMNSLFKLSFLTLFILIGCGSDNKNNNSPEGSAEIGKSLFNNATKTIANESLDVFGLWEEQTPAKDSLTRIEITPGVDNKVFVKIAKKCIFADITLYSGIKIKGSIKNSEVLELDSTYDFNTNNGDYNCFVSTDVVENNFILAHIPNQHNLLLFRDKNNLHSISYVKIQLTTEPVDNNGGLKPTLLPTSFSYINDSKGEVGLRYGWKSTNLISGSRSQDHNILYLNLVEKENPAVSFRNFEIKKLQPYMTCCGTEPVQGNTKTWDDNYLIISPIYFHAGGPAGTWIIKIKLQYNLTDYEFEIPVELNVN